MKKNLFFILIGIVIIVFASIRIASNNTIYYYTTTEISFDGFIPELFQDEMGVILDGYFDNGIFYSDDMLVKHDNEYISEDGEVYNVENYKE